MNRQLPASGISPPPPPPPCQDVLLCKRLQLNASECDIALSSGVTECDFVFSLVMCFSLRILHCLFSGAVFAHAKTKRFDLNNGFTIKLEIVL